MRPIATLTLNPALDVTTETETVRPTHKLRCGTPAFEAGGGGVNVARVVHALGGAVTAIFPAGGPAGATMERLLCEEGVTALAVPITGATRESVTVNETGTGEQYRFVLPGPELSDVEQAALLAAIEALDPRPAWIVASGSLPPECDPAILARLAVLCGRMDARLAVDTSGPALAACEGIGVHLLKPSLRELEDLLGEPLDGDAAIEAAARTLLARRFADIVVVSLGEQGALLASGDQLIRMAAVAVPGGGGAVGAGDSMVAALVLALVEGRALDDALRFGVAAGGAALMTAPSDLVRRVDVERLYAASLLGTAQNSP